MANEYVQVFTTVEKREDADRIASIVVSKRAVACAQIMGPIRSTYWWKGKVEEAWEWLVMMKTRKDLYSSLEKEIRAAHPYEVPEIIALPIVAGSKPYLQWIEEETEKK
ncbi:MAG: divalent-cation tolerance protein CutA [Deltaproteobacteria bacterium]